MNKRQIATAITSLQRRYKLAPGVTSTGKPKKKGAHSLHNVDRNLVLRIAHTGECSFLFRGTFGGKEFTHRLCRYNPADHDGSFSRARERVNQYRQWMDEGHDPRVMQSDAQSSHAATLRDVIETWLAIRKPAAPESIRASFERHIYPHTADGLAPVDTITEARWRTMLSGIILAGTPEMAKKLLRWIKAALRVGKMHAGASVREIEPITIKDLGVKSKPRDRVLELRELAKISDWMNTPRARAAYYQNTARLLMFMCARTQEIRLSRISEWDLTANVWTVPAEHSKNADLITRPIPAALQPFVRSLVASAKLNRSPYLLGELRSESTVSEYGRTLHKRLGLDHFTFHDFRRTAATLMAENGVPEDVREGILGHSRDLVAATYTRATMLGAKRDALEMLYRLISLHAPQAVAV